jgi:hypothetical protein
MLVLKFFIWFFITSLICTHLIEGIQFCRRTQWQDFFGLFLVIAFWSENVITVRARGLGHTVTAKNAFRLIPV